MGKGLKEKEQNGAERKAGSGIEAKIMIVNNFFRKRHFRGKKKPKNG